MPKPPMVSRADLIRCLMVAKDDEELERLAKICGYAQKATFEEKPEKK